MERDTETQFPLPLGATGPLLTKAEEYALIAKAQRGDRRAMDELLRKNSRFVVMLAKRYRGPGLALDDLYQAGMLGLSLAIERFDPSKGFRLTTYASWWIRSEFQRAMGEGARLIYLPARIVETMRHADRVIQRELAETGQEPTERSVAKEAGIPVKRIRVAREAELLKSVMSLDSPVSDEENANFVDLQTDDEAELPEDALLGTERRKLLTAAALALLTTVEIAILRCRYVDDLTLEETAQKVAPLCKFKRTLTRERIRQKEQAALRKLREALTETGFTST
jgi:RNA polymerase primary sigma factor